MEPLKRVQVEGQLMFAEPQDLFGNLDEVCSVMPWFHAQLYCMQHAAMIASCEIDNVVHTGQHNYLATSVSR